MVLPTTDLAHLYPELWSRLGAAGTQAHTAFKPKATGEFQKHGTWPLPSLRVHITGRSESLSQSTPLQPSRHRQPAGPDTSKLALTSSHALNSQATSWTTFPGAQQDALAAAAPSQTEGQPQSLLLLPILIQYTVLLPPVWVRLCPNAPNSEG